MKIYCCFTPAHEVLFRRYFQPSLPITFKNEQFPLAISGAGDFLSPEFLRCICEKVDLILDSIRKNAGEVIVWSDVDIQFFDITPELLIACLAEYDIAFQPEGHGVTDVNTGFFVCRCAPGVLEFFNMVKEGLIQNSAANEQLVANQILSSNSAELSWTYLPFSFYARSHGWPPPRALALYHANATTGQNGIAQKEQQFCDLSFLRRFGLIGIVTTSVKNLPRRVRRLLSC